MEWKRGSVVVVSPFVGPERSDCLRFLPARLRFHDTRGHPVPWCRWAAAFWSPLFGCSLAQQVWFKNRRAKWRRQKRSSSEESENAEKWNKTSSKASPEKREEEGKSDLDSDS